MKWLLQGAGWPADLHSKDVMKEVFPPSDLALRGVQPGGWKSAAGVSQPSAKIRVGEVKQPCSFHRPNNETLNPS